MEAEELIRLSAMKTSMTNCFLGVKELTDGIASGRFKVLWNEPLILAEDTDNYRRIFYFTGGTGASINRKVRESILDNRLPIYADITLNGTFTYQSSVFEQLGLKPFRTYVRKTAPCKGILYSKKLDPVFASSGDVQEIMKLLTDAFDPMADHLPDSSELYDLTDKGAVLKLMDNGSIMGALIFEDTGKKSYLRALCIAQRYRGKCAGSSLMAEYFRLHSPEKTAMFYLWMEESNEGAAALYDKFGYAPDGLRNYIFRN